MLAKGPSKVSPMLIPMDMPNGPAAYVSLQFNARAGAFTPVSACATGAEAIGYGVDLLQLPEHAGRDLRYSVPGDEKLGLGAFTGSWRPDEDEPHFVGLLGSPGMTEIKTGGLITYGKNAA